jgi:hypothetical protein
MHMGTRLRLLIAVGMLVMLALAAPAAGAAPPTQQTKNVYFYIYDKIGNPIALTVTNETFHGNSGVATGTWTTYAVIPIEGTPTDVVLASGRLTARHSETGLVATLTQQSPVHGHGTLTTNSLTGVGSLDYVVQGGASGTVNFLAVPAAPPITDVFAVFLLGPVPPVLFTGGN